MQIVEKKIVGFVLCRSCLACSLPRLAGQGDKIVWIIGWVEDLAGILFSVYLGAGGVYLLLNDK